MIGLSIIAIDVLLNEQMVWLQGLLVNDGRSDISSIYHKYVYVLAGVLG